MSTNNAACSDPVNDFINNSSSTRSCCKRLEFGQSIAQVEAANYNSEEHLKMKMKQGARRKGGRQAEKQGRLEPACVLYKEFSSVQKLTSMVTCQDRPQGGHGSVPAAGSSCSLY